MSSRRTATRSTSSTGGSVHPASCTWSSSGSRSAASRPTGTGPSSSATMWTIPSVSEPTREEMMTELLMLGGVHTPAADEATTAVIEPSTGEPAWEVAQAGPEDARRAVDVAARAFDEGAWPRMSARARGRILTAASLLIREHQEDLARLEARNGGKPIGSARAEIDIVANVFEYWGGAANKIFGETIPIVPPGLDVTLREPVGVCVLITPWNFPAGITSWRMAPALGRGTTATPKPASRTT